MNKTTINTTATAAVNAKFPAKYYDRQLLESAKTRFVHAEFGQKRPIPRNSGKYVNFRRWNLFDPETAISGLVEGETPTGQTLSQTDVEAEVKQYGAYVESVVEDSPAEKGGIKSGDIIVSVNGNVVSTAAEVTAEVTNCNVGDEIEIGIIRDNKTKTMKVTLGEYKGE